MFRLAMIIVSALFFALLILLTGEILVEGLPAFSSGVLTDRLLLTSVGISVRTSLLATLLASLVGTPVAYLLAYYHFPGKKILDTYIELPVVLPPLVLGISLVLISGSRSPLGSLVDRFFPFLFTERGVVVAQFLVASPFYIRTVRYSMEKIPVNLVNASDTLQASELYRFFHLILPLSREGILAGMSLAWARALGEFGATAMVAGSAPGKTETLTLMIYRNAASGKTDHALAGAVILIVLSMSILIVVKWRFARGTHGIRDI